MPLAKIHTHRTRLGKDIVAEFMPSQRQNKKQRVIIFCDGAPTIPNKRNLMLEFSRLGFWVFHPRYRGTWESDGKFLQQSPHLDVLDSITAISHGFKDLWDNKKYKLNPDQIILVGGSFGGPAQLLAAKDERVSKAVVFAPVIDWKKLGSDEPISFMKKFFPEAFGNGYRVAKNGWEKLQTGKFYNPMYESDTIPGEKIIIFHAKDDKSCPYGLSKKFAEKIGCKFVPINKGGHQGTSLLFEPRYFKIFKKFIDQI